MPTAPMLGNRPDILALVERRLRALLNTLRSDAGYGMRHKLGALAGGLLGTPDYDEAEPAPRD